MSDKLTPEDAAQIDQHYKAFLHILTATHDRVEDAWLRSFLTQAIGNLERCKNSLDWISKPEFPHEP